jgi:heme/copper-type cytochrome/quinol oxidase subunit 1
VSGSPGMTHGGYGNSLEWATSCPPPRHNFTKIPRIRSGRLAFGLRYPHIQTGRTRRPVPPASTPPSA